MGGSGRSRVLAPARIDAELVVDVLARRRTCLDDLEALADDVLRAVEQVGAAGDDASLLLARPPF